MLMFQGPPDEIFLAILEAALLHVRDCHLVQYRDDYRPTRAEREELDELYADLYPDLAKLFTRTRLIRMIDRLLAASRAEAVYRPTDYHWMIMYACLATYCDLHNDNATGTGDKVGAYEIERIDFGEIVDRFFWDTDFLMGSLLLQAEEKAPGRMHATRQAWKIAAQLKPNSADMRLSRLSSSAASEWLGERDSAFPKAGYVGPYPLRESAADDDR